MKKVALFFGGRSTENEISVLTGVFVLNLLDREKYIPFPVYIHTDGLLYTSSECFRVEAFKKRDFSSFKRVIIEGGKAYLFRPEKSRLKPLGKIDVAINCCHGGWGEGGGVSALMERNGVPIASPELTESGVFLDKALTKLLAKALNIPVVEYIRFNEADYAKRGKFLLKNIAARLKYPVVVKPARGGSSIGITLAKDEDEVKEGIEAAFELDKKLVVERYVQGKLDVNCAAYSLGGEIFVSEPEIAARGGIYTFSDKYLRSDEDGVRTKDGGRVEANEKLSSTLREKIRAATRTVYRRTGLKGIVRMDFLVSGEEYYLGEVNTVPGSLAYYLFCERISEAKSLFGALIEDAILEKPKRTPTTGVLQAAKLSSKRGDVRL